MPQRSLDEVQVAGLVVESGGEGMAEGSGRRRGVLFWLPGTTGQTAVAPAAAREDETAANTVERRYEKSVPVWAAGWGFDSPRLHQFPVYTKSSQPFDRWPWDGALDLDVLRSMPQGMMYRDAGGSSNLTR